MLSTPKFFIISNATAVDALPEIGLININGKTSLGIFSNPKNGFKAFCIKSKIPEFLRALIAKNKAISVGKILITVSIPSFAPNQKTIKDFYFFCESIRNNVNYYKRYCNYRYVIYNIHNLHPSFTFQVL